MNKTKLLTVIFSCILPLTSCTNSDNSNSSVNEDVKYDRELNVFFDTNQTLGAKISPFIYGTFIEHIGTCIYDGIWAEEINDRKFVAPIGKDVSQWKKGKDNLVESDSTNTYSGSYSAVFTKDASMYQRGFKLNKFKYNGYFYAFGEGKVEFCLSNAKNEIRKTIDINSSTYQKYTYDMDIVEQGEYKLTITSLSGSFHMDSLSLMQADNYYGMRTDTLELLKQLNAPFYRYPGGNFVSGYDFYDGIGDRDKRESKRNLEYAGLLDSFKNDADRLASDLTNIENSGFYAIYEPNDFGIDEFMMFCKYLNATPNVVLNSGLGDVKQAIDEIEYINGTNSYYASLRPQKEPYNVKYFSIGNEMNGSWQLGHMDISDYIAKHNQFATEIKKVDPNIEIIAVGDNSSNWSQQMINGCKDNINYLSEHFYATRDEYSVEEHIKSLKNQAEYRINQHRNLKDAGNIKMSIDEYAYDKAQTSSRLKDGMGVASCLNVFMKNSDVVDIACYSSTVNATQGQIVTDGYNAYLEGSGAVCSLYSKYMQDYSLNISFNARKLGLEDYVEVSATINFDKTRMSIAVINTSSEILKITNSKIKKIFSRSYLTAESFESINSINENDLELIYDDTSTNKCLVNPRSVTLFIVEI